MRRLPSKTSCSDQKFSFAMSVMAPVCSLRYCLGHKFLELVFGIGFGVLIHC